MMLHTADERQEAHSPDSGAGAAPAAGRPMLAPPIPDNRCTLAGSGAVIWAASAACWLRGEREPDGAPASPADAASTPSTGAA